MNFSGISFWEYCGVRTRDMQKGSNLHTLPYYRPYHTIILILEQPLAYHQSESYMGARWCWRTLKTPLSVGLYLQPVLRVWLAVNLITGDLLVYSYGGLGSSFTLDFSVFPLDFLVTGCPRAFYVRAARFPGFSIEASAEISRESDFL